MSDATVVVDSKALSYREHLAIAWLVAWRGVVFSWFIGFACSLPLSLAVLFGADPAKLQVLMYGGRVAAFLMAIFVVGPFFVVLPMIKKHFRGFRVTVVRE